MKILLEENRIEFSKWLGSRKGLALILITWIFEYYNFHPLMRMALYYGETLPPAAFVFYFGYTLMAVLQVGLTVFMYADILSQDRYNRYIILRTGRKRFVQGKLFFIFTAAILDSLLVYVISLLMTCPALHIENEWGKIIYGLSENGRLMVEQTGYKLVYTPNRLMLDVLKPYEALGYALLLLCLVNSFLGMLILFMSVAVNRICGVMAAGVLAALPFFINNLGYLSLGYRCLYFSPVSWCLISNLDWYHTGTMPSVTYAVMFLLIGIVLMGFGTLLIIEKKEAEV